MKTLTAFLLFLGTVSICSDLLACDRQARQLITTESRSLQIPPEYTLAMARHLTACRPDYRDRQGRVGLMGLRPDLLPADIRDDRNWLDYPSINVRMAVQLLDQLLEEHGDWEKALTVFHTGSTRSSRQSRRWIQAVFRDAHAGDARCPVGRLQHHHDLDDFGPGGPAHRYRPLRSSDWQPIRDGSRFSSRCR